MPKKAKVIYVCSNCGAEAATWSGRCHECGEWNTLQEQVTNFKISGHGQGSRLSTQTIKVALAADQPRLVVGVKSIDDVLGGGIVAGSVTLIAGQPGIGKSTLLLQIADYLSKNHKLLYVSGEESSHQISVRAGRLKLANDKVELATATSAETVGRAIASKDYELVIVDSIQTMSIEAISSAAGSVSQITNSTQLLANAAKQSGTSVILVGHVTKEGSIAGPKVLEHIVDVVLQLEGDRYGGFKLLKTVKNRYGSTNQSSIFEMTDTGLQPVSNPSAALLAERQVSDGSVVLATMEGNRAVLVEVQALVNKTSYGYPKRAVSGMDLSRLNLLIAMLERRTKLQLAEQDIYVNIVGGLRLGEPAADLAVCMSIASAAKGMQLKRNAVVFGEVGLSGEVRHVPNIDQRLAEAASLNFEACIGPSSDAKQAQKSKSKLDYYGVKTVREALLQFLEKD